MFFVYFYGVRVSLFVHKLSLGDMQAKHFLFRLLDSSDESMFYEFEVTRRAPSCGFVFVRPCVT